MGMGSNPPILRAAEAAGVVKRVGGRYESAGEWAKNKERNRDKMDEETEMDTEGRKHKRRLLGRGSGQRGTLLGEAPDVEKKSMIGG